MNKIFIIVSVLLILFSIVSVGIHNTSNTEEKFQGPVPLGYDLEHYRETGLTIKVVNTNGANRLG